MKASLAELFGESVRTRRLSKGWSQMKLAAESDLHLTALGSIERGRRNPSLMTVFLIARALDVSPEELIAEVDQAGPNLSYSDNYLGQQKQRPGRPKK